MVVEVTAATVVPVEATTVDVTVFISVVTPVVGESVEREMRVEVIVGRVVVVETVVVLPGSVVVVEMVLQIEDVPRIVDVFVTV